MAGSVVPPGVTPGVGIDGWIGVKHNFSLHAYWEHRASKVLGNFVPVTPKQRRAGRFSSKIVKTPLNLYSKRRKKPVLSTRFIAVS